MLLFIFTVDQSLGLCDFLVSLCDHRLCLEQIGHQQRMISFGAVIYYLPLIDVVLCFSE